jgi:dienelactone hydrolase
MSESPRISENLAGRGRSLVAPAITGTVKQRNPSTGVYATGGAAGAGADTFVAGTTTADEAAAATAARAAKSFLFQLPDGRPHRQGTGGIAATGSLAFTPLSSGRPRLCPPDPLAPLAPEAPMVDMAEAGVRGRRGGGSME